jgi:hypothetical protein
MSVAKVSALVEVIESLSSKVVEAHATLSNREKGTVREALTRVVESLRSVLPEEKPKRAQKPKAVASQEGEAKAAQPAKEKKARKPAAPKAAPESTAAPAATESTAPAAVAAPVAAPVEAAPAAAPAVAAEAAPAKESTKKAKGSKKQ